MIQALNLGGDNNAQAGVSNYGLTVGTIGLIRVSSDFKPLVEDKGCLEAYPKLWRIRKSILSGLSWVVETSPQLIRGKSKTLANKKMYSIWAKLGCRDKPTVNSSSCWCWAQASVVKVGSGLFRLEERRL